VDAERKRGDGRDGRVEDDERDVRVAEIRTARSDDGLCERGGAAREARRRADVDADGARVLVAGDMLAVRALAVLVARDGGRDVLRDAVARGEDDVRGDQRAGAELERAARADAEGDDAGDRLVTVVLGAAEDAGVGRPRRERAPSRSRRTSSRPRSP